MCSITNLNRLIILDHGSKTNYLDLNTWTRIYNNTYLHIALDEIERCDGHVSETAAENPTDGARGVEIARVHLDTFPRLGGGGDEEVLARRHRRRRRVLLEVGGLKRGV